MLDEVEEVQNARKKLPHINTHEDVINVIKNAKKASPSPSPSTIYPLPHNLFLLCILFHYSLPSTLCYPLFSPLPLPSPSPL